MTEACRPTEEIVLRGACTAYKMTDHETVNCIKAIQTYQDSVCNEGGVCEDREDDRAYCSDCPEGDQTSDGDKDKVGRASMNVRERAPVAT